ncbi:MAG: hypothetical protein BGO98_33675 [Myxococcales bacterium 68-20]|nr:MAG: hypothetical protein BGO98_33675 [Myxococcales bacterium 68-20]
MRRLPSQTRDGRAKGGPLDRLTLALRCSSATELVSPNGRTSMELEAHAFDCASTSSLVDALA